MTKLYKISDVFPDWSSISSLFNRLNRLSVPWAADVQTQSLDIEYFLNRSGEKYCSPLVNKLSGGEILTTANIDIICNVLVSLYGENWNREYAVLSFDYNPIENYSMTEAMTNDDTTITFGKTNTLTRNTTDTETPNTTETRTDNLSHGKTGTETRTPLTTNTTDNGITGFNSTDDVHTGTTTVSASGTDTMTYNTTDADTGTVTTGVTGTVTTTGTGTLTNADSGTEKHEHGYNLTRSGNIGVTTSQQMTESEIALWRWNFFNDVVFPDIDRVLTLMIY